MSLLGLRDMSLIETPPKDRLAIHTVVAHFDANLIKTAIEQEMSRGGQVYFIHNRVDTIFMRAAMIQELLPNARIGVGHGQMGEASLKKCCSASCAMSSMCSYRTTIVENGIDIPLANTMIIENAERYGLSELYQLRGRVGRSNRRAYAYLLVPADTRAQRYRAETAGCSERIQRFRSGLQNRRSRSGAARRRQSAGRRTARAYRSGGFDMYIRLLEETVQELKGEEVPLEIHSTLNLGLDIRIPPDYVPEEEQRLRAYKRIADLKTEEQAQKIRDEFADRYGAPPAEVENLIRFSLLKSLAERVGAESIDRRQGFANIKFHPQSKIDPLRLMEMVRRTPGAQFTPAGVLKVPIDGAQPTALILQLRDQLEQLESA